MNTRKTRTAKTQPLISTAPVSDAEDYTTLSVTKSHDVFELVLGECEVTNPSRYCELRICSNIEHNELIRRFTMEGPWVVLDGVTTAQLREMARELTAAANQMDKLCDAVAPLMGVPAATTRLRQA